MALWVGLKAGDLKLEDNELGLEGLEALIIAHFIIFAFIFNPCKS